MRLKDKVALITGSSRGIGETIATAFVQAGAKVVINGRNRAKLEKVASKITQAGGSVLAIPADVTIKHEVHQMVAAAYEHFSNIDILVNNAGQLFLGTIEDITVEDWDHAMKVNLKSVFLCSQAIIPHMKRRHQGRIINISSGGGKNACTITGVNYGVSKAGVIYLSKRMAADLGQYNITVNCIAPGAVDTEMIKAFTPGVFDGFAANIPLGRIGQTADVAKIALFFASDDADYITGEVLDVNGGGFID